MARTCIQCWQDRKKATEGFEAWERCLECVRPCYPDQVAFSASSDLGLFSAVVSRTLGLTFAFLEVSGREQLLEVCVPCLRLRLHRCSEVCQLAGNCLFLGTACKRIRIGMICKFDICPLLLWDSELLGVEGWRCIWVDMLKGMGWE